MDLQLDLTWIPCRFQQQKGTETVAPQDDFMLHTNSKIANRQPVGREFFSRVGQDQVIIMVIL